MSIGDAIAGAQEGSREIRITVEVVHPIDGEQILSGEGLFDGSLAELQIDGSRAPNEAGFYGEFESFGAAFRGTDVFYEILPDPPAWLELSLSESSPSEGRDIGQLRELSLANPSILLGLFKRIDAEGPVGPNEIDGEAMARFDIPVNMGRAWPPKVQPLADILIDDFGIEELEVHLWVDAGNRLRRIEENFLYPIVLAAEPNIEVSIIIDLGTEPLDESPEIPSESEIRTLGDLS